MTEINLLAVVNGVTEVNYTAVRDLISLHSRMSLFEEMDDALHLQYRHFKWCELPYHIRMNYTTIVLSMECFRAKFNPIVHHQVIIHQARMEKINKTLSNIATTWDNYPEIYR